MRLSRLGICGIISLLSYTAMVVFSPLAYPGYDWMRMAVSDLSADGAPSQALAEQLNALFGPCAVVSIMAVCVAVARCRSKTFKVGIYFFATMEWICTVGYKLFPWVAGASNTHPQNVMHLIVTVLVVVFSLTALVLIAIGASKTDLESLGIWAIICLAAMLIGAAGTALLPATVFGLVERFSTFSAVVFNAVLGIYLLMGKFDLKEKGQLWTKRVED